MKRYILALVALLFSASFAYAQNTTKLCYSTNGSNCVPVDASNPLPVTSGGGGGSLDVNVSEVNGATPSATNPIWVAPASSTAFPAIAAPRSALTVAGCSVGVASAQCLAGSTANFWVQVQNTSVSATIACSWGGTAALNSNGSFMLVAGQSASWGVASSGVPTNALNCIASGAATPLYVEYR